MPNHNSGFSHLGVPAPAGMSDCYESMSRTTIRDRPLRQPPHRFCSLSPWERARVRVNKSPLTIRRPNNNRRHRSGDSRIRPVGDGPPPAHRRQRLSRPKRQPLAAAIPKSNLACTMAILRSYDLSHAGNSTIGPVLPTTPARRSTRRNASERTLLFIHLAVTGRASHSWHICPHAHSRQLHSHNASTGRSAGQYPRLRPLRVGRLDRR